MNVVKGKQLTNIRSAGADEKLILAPPRQLTLESAMDFIDDDKRVENHPNDHPIAQAVLPANMRSIVRGERKK